MKKLIHLCTFVLLLFMFQSCLKDTCTQTFKVYRPVLQSKQEIRAKIKNSPVRALRKPGKLTLWGHYIFLNEVDKGIHVIDNSNPDKPVSLSFIEIPGNVDIAVHGNILYADLYDELVSIDVSDPAGIRYLGSSTGAFPHRAFPNGFAADTSMFIVDWAGKDTTVSINCTSPNWRAETDRVFAAAGMVTQFSNTAAIAPANGINGSMARFAVLKDYIYTVSDNELFVFHLSSTERPVRVNRMILGWGIETIYPFRNNLFIGSANGMFIYNAQNPAAPSLLGSFAHAFACDPVIADDSYAYITLRNGTACRNGMNQLDVVDIQNLSNPFLIKSYPLTNPHGLSKDGTVLFVCDGKDGLRIFDATQPHNLKPVKQFTGIETYDVIAVNNNAIVVCKEALVQYDYSNPSVIKERSRINIQK
jgi:hypothetical protein